MLLLLLCFLVLVVGHSNTCLKDSSVALETPLPTKSPRWAIICLARFKKNDLNQRNKALAVKLAPYVKDREVDIIFFSENVATPLMKATHKKQFANMNVKVKYMNTAHLAFKGKPNRGFGYKYMCKFFAIDVFDMLNAAGYDYYLRCDTDCIIDTLDYDIFTWTEKHKVEYAYSARKLEAHKPTRETIVPFVQKYMQNCGIEPASLLGYPISKAFNFYNNFHIGATAFFLREDVQHFLQAVNNSGQIWENRWGDSTIQAYAVRLFAKEDRIKFVPQFAYVHGSHSNRKISTANGGKDTDLPQKLPPHEVPEE
jgi:hypothetical protein